MCANNQDGVEFDVEFFNADSLLDNMVARAYYTNMMMLLRQKLDAPRPLLSGDRRLITIDVAGPITDNWFFMVELNKEFKSAIDFVNVMAYGWSKEGLGLPIHDRQC